jgi:hypothetical protein
MHRQRMFMLVAAIVGALACFLPWMNLPIVGAISGTQGPDGWVVLCLFAAAAGLPLLGERAQPLTTGPGLGAGALGAISAGIGLWKIIAFHDNMSDLGADNAFASALTSTVSLGVGLYLVVAAGVAIPIIPIIVTPRASQSKLRSAALPAVCAVLMLLAVAASAGIERVGKKAESISSTPPRETDVAQRQAARAVQRKVVLEFGRPTVTKHRHMTEVMVEATNATDRDVRMCSVTATFKKGDTILGTAIGALNDLAADATKTLNLMGMDDVDGYDTLKIEADTCL